MTESPTSSPSEPVTSPEVAGSDISSPQITLAMIARSDAAGLERAILSAQPYVDEIDIAVDGRSDDATKAVAEKYADRFSIFNAADIGLSPEDWQADKIHFANARNIGRNRTQTPWTLFLDTDEYLTSTVDLREAVKNTQASSIELCVKMPDTDFYDNQRLTKTEFKWWRHTHNQLHLSGISDRLDKEKICIVHDTSIRSDQEKTRRFVQRNAASKHLEEDADAGDLSALFHVAKHSFSYADAAECERLVQKYRFKAEPHGVLAGHRMLLALTLGIYFYEKKQDIINAELWAIRALLDGPYPEAFCLLGDIAEDIGELENALTWYEIACVTPAVPGVVLVRTLFDARESRRAELREKCKRPSNP